MEQELKIWPEYFDAVSRGDKKFEIRKNDRDFQVGQFWTLKEWDPETEEYTGDWIRIKITYILCGGVWGIPEDVCIFSFVRVQRGSIHYTDNP